MFPVYIQLAVFCFILAQLNPLLAFVTWIGEIVNFLAALLIDFSLE